MTPQSFRRAYAARRFTSAYELAMDARYEVTRNMSDEALGPEALVRAALGSEVLFCCLTEKINAEVIGHLAPTLKVIANLSVGLDHIDLAAAERFGVHVLNTPDVLSEATAEVAMMLILNACRRAYESDHMVRSGQWTGWTPTQMLGLGLPGRRLGILGLGRIGQQLAKRAAPFGLEIHYHNRRQLPPETEAGAFYHATSDSLLRHSDIFCIAAPSTPELKGFLDVRRIALLPKDAVVVNVARGDMVDDEALIEGLTSGKLFAAGLDVYRGEPNLDPRYRALPNAFLASHIGSATIDTRDAMGFLLLDGLRALEDGRRPHNLVV
jgi:lactate dehydrogenase-like 2-hydroxyacid dehydrogenase